MKERLRAWLRRSLLGLAVGLLLWLAVLFFLPRWSVGRNETPAVEVIYVTAYDPRLRTVEYAAALYQQGVAKKIACLSNAMTCDIFPSDFARRHLLALGVPEADVSVGYMPDTDCRAQLFAPALQFTQQNGWRRILWIVDPVGSRMMRSVMQPKFKAAGIEMFVTYPPAAEQDFKHDWWREHWKVQRLAYDVLGTSLDLFYAECR